jgi:hypothetical protein
MLVIVKPTCTFTPVVRFFGTRAATPRVRNSLLSLATISRELGSPPNKSMMDLTFLQINGGGGGGGGGGDAFVPGVDW